MNYFSIPPAVRDNLAPDFRVHKPTHLNGFVVCKTFCWTAKFCSVPQDFVLVLTTDLL